MVTLQPFAEGDFNRLIQWIDTKEDLVQFAGPLFSYPLTKEQLLVYVQNSKRYIYKVVLDENGLSIGHCEINLTHAHPRLSRILIGEPELRGKGLGQAIVKEMLKKIKNAFPGEDIDLKVFSWNKGAIRCYEKAGFNIIHDQTTTLNYGGISWTRLHMKYSDQKKRSAI
jgi:RimJ/RimL family protein N-acetyltransferase